MSEVLRLSPNRWVGALDPRYVVLHTTQGTDSLGWLTNPASQVSATLLIPRDGPDWYRMTAPRDAAWHAGFTAEPRTPLFTGVNPNLEAYGIEIEGYADTPITPFQVDVAADFIDHVGLPFCDHADLATRGTYYRSDPGLENSARIRVAVYGGGSSMPGFTAEQWATIDARIREVVMAEDIAPYAVYAALGRATGNLPPRTTRRRTFRVPPSGQRGEWPADRGAEPLPRGRKGVKK